MATTQKNLEALERARSIKDVPWCEEYEAMISGMMYVFDAATAKYDTLTALLGSALGSLPYCKGDD